MAGRLVLRGCDALVGPDLELRVGVDIAVEDDLVVEIGTGLQDAGAEIDARGQLAVPGLVNCHTHIGDAAFFGRAFGHDPADLLWPPDGLRHRWMAESGPDVVRAGIRSALEIMIGSGTVLFADFREQGVAGVRLLRQAMAGLAVQAIVFGRHENFPLHQDAELVANTAGLGEDQLRDVDRILDEAAGFSPLWANDTTDLGLRQTAERVRARGGRLATHAGETPVYRDTSRARTGSGDVERVVEHLKPDFVVHMTSALTEEFGLLREAGTPVVMCPRTQAALGIGLPPFLEALDAGVLVGLGTDNAMLTMPDLLAEMSFYYRALRAATGQSARPLAEELLRAATVDGARILGVSETHGHIDVGRPAHLFLLDRTGPGLRHVEDPVVAVACAASAADVRLVLIGGEVAHRQ